MFQYSAESIQEVMNSIHDALFIHDAESGKIVFVNKRVSELYNCTDEEALNISVGKLSLGTPPYSDEDAMRWLKKAKKEGEQIFEWIARKKTGETFWTEVVLRFAKINKESFVIAIVRDISKRKETELEKQKTVSQLQAILDACTDVIAIIDNEGVFHGGNKAFLARWGKTYDQIIGHSATEILPPHIFTSRLQIIRDVIKSKKGTTFVDTYNGHWFENTISPVIESVGKDETVAMYSKDITEWKKSDDLIRESEAYYRIIFENTGTATIIIEDDTTISLANSKFEELSGYTKREIENKKSWKDFVVKEDLERMMEQHKQRRINEEAALKTYEFRFIDKSGKEKHILVTNDLITNTKKSVASLLDITERKNAENELHESEEKYRTLIESATDSIIIIKEGLIQYVNKVLLNLSGYTEQELIGQPFINYISPDYKDKVLEYYRKRIAGETTPIGYELTALKKNGEEVPYEATASILTYMGEKAELVFLHDITERKITAGELLKNKQELDSIYNTVGDVIFQLVVEDENKFRFNSVNKTFSTVTGIDASMVIGKAVNEIIPEPSLSMVLQNYQKAIKQKTIVRWEETSEYPTGTLVGVVSVAPVFDETGKCTHLVGSVHDITERKIIENKIKKLNEELEERVNLRTIQLENANKELEAFAYSVSHDLRAPLRAISGFSKILTEDYSDKIEAEGQRVCNVIQNETSRMGQLIDDLLAFSRLSRTSMQIAPTDMRPLVQQIFDEIKKQYEDKQVNFILGDILPSMVDISLMRQVWVNLFSNAFKFSSKKGIIEIEIGSYKEQSEIIYFIKDKGAGFDMKYVDKLFRVFQRLHNLNEFQGTGVGLAIVQRIIHRHGGRVWAEGEINKGAAFYFSLPYKKETL